MTEKELTKGAKRILDEGEELLGHVFSMKTWECHVECDYFVCILVLVLGKDFYIDVGESDARNTCGFASFFILDQDGLPVQSFLQQFFACPCRYLAPQFKCSNFESKHWVLASYLWNCRIFIVWRPSLLVANSY